MKNSFISIGSGKKRQGGAVLIVGLIFLLILTIIALNAISDSDIQERMAGNSRDRNMAFQAAETALSSAESFINNNQIVFDGTRKGYWPDLNLNSNISALQKELYPALTDSPTFWTSAQWEAFSLQLPKDTLSDVSQQPRYAIEKIVVSELAATQGSGIDVESQEKFAMSNYYRITAQGYGLTDNSIVTIQSTYIP